MRVVVGESVLAEGTAACARGAEAKSRPHGEKPSPGEVSSADGGVVLVCWGKNFIWKANAVLETLSKQMTLSLYIVLDVLE